MRFRPVLHLLTFSLMYGLICSEQETQPPYRNPKLTVEERAPDLLQYGSRLSVPLLMKWLPSERIRAFTPVLDLARDPRWGRTEETYGEDPFLVARGR